MNDHPAGEFLKDTGQLPDQDIDLAHTALDLAALDHLGISIGRYTNHLKETGEAVAARFKALRDAGAADDSGTRLASLKYVLSETQGFQGAHEEYDNIENADLMRVIDRRKGLPIALAILYIDAARRQGWVVSGINLPGHFVVRLEGDDGRIIFDPSNDCGILQASHLRKIVKDRMGPSAELSASYFEPAGNRQILLRLQNNIKIRLIQGEDYAGALRIVEAMRLIDPQEYRLLLDAGVLYARTGQNDKAVMALEGYLPRAENEKDRRDAALLLQHLRNGA